MTSEERIGRVGRGEHGYRNPDFREVGNSGPRSVTDLKGREKGR